MELAQKGKKVLPCFRRSIIWTKIRKTQLREHEAYKKLMLTDETYLYVRHS